MQPTTTCGHAIARVLPLLLLLVVASSTAAARTETPASSLLPIASMRSEQPLPAPVSNAAFVPPPQAQAAPPFSGTLLISHARMQTLPVLDKPMIRDRDARLFPSITLHFVSIGAVLAPLERGEMVRESTHPGRQSYWRVIPQFGRIWREAADGEWSRAAFPLMLVNDTENDAHQGLATFLYRGESITQLRFQFVQQSTPYLIPQHFVAWGSSGVAYDPQLRLAPQPDLQKLQSALGAELASRLPAKPWSELTRTAVPGVLDGFGAPLAAKWIVMNAVVRDGTIYYSESATPYGPYPYPMEMRFAPRSVLKAIGVPLALLRLAEVYGPYVLNLKVGDYVKVADPKYRRVRFIDAANMATGMGGFGSLRTNPNDSDDGYIDPNYDDWYLAPSQAEKLQQIDAHNLPYPWEPGAVMRYRDQDYYLLGAALDAFLKSVRGPQADLWDMLRTEVFAPIGIYHAPVVRTREPNGVEGIAWMSAGYYPTVDELAKIAILYLDKGAHAGQQLLHSQLTAQLLTTEDTIRESSDMTSARGLPERSSEELLYKMGFHFYPYTHERTGTRVYVPTMRGSSGNLIALYPNHVVSMRLAKAWPMPEAEQKSENPVIPMLRAIDRLTAF